MDDWVALEVMAYAPVNPDSDLDSSVGRKGADRFLDPILLIPILRLRQRAACILPNYYISC
jgi:hypothetical protein